MAWRQRVGDAYLLLERLHLIPVPSASQRGGTTRPLHIKGGMGMTFSDVVASIEKKISVVITR